MSDRLAEIEARATHCPDCCCIARECDVFCWACGAVVCSPDEPSEGCPKCAALANIEGGAT